MSNPDSEETFVASRRGKWSSAGVPKQGWKCVNIEDLGGSMLECEMCEFRMIRYVHHMEHRDFQEVLRVGCTCAGHMEGDLDGARQRESTIRRRINKRRRWLSRTWNLSNKGTPTWRTGDYRITVYERGSGWAWTVAEEIGSLVQHSPRNFESLDQAKLASFDHITRLEARMQPHENRK